MYSIQVVGAGSFGLALARLLANNGNAVRLWCREEDGPDTLRSTRENRAFLPGILLPDAVEVDRAIEPGVDIAVYAVPSHIMRLAAAAHRFSGNTIRVSVAKGIENDSLLRMSEIIREVAPGGPVVALSGPSHAEEVAHDLPASVVVASDCSAACETVQKAFFARSFRVYTSTDIAGVELGGSLKNVIAIAAGVCDGLGLGDNAKSALMTRGLAEMARLGVALGADPLTFAGLSGMGDLITTCTSPHSRNRRLGEGLARGKTLDELTGNSPMVAEGVRTTRSAVALALKANVELPIAEAVHHVLFDGAQPREAIYLLLNREARPEAG
ncbi:MAG: NAD(P)-dependent glycerol-3-phosphate dehydrogenase [Candidatus Hydrogenedentes bacterium]|nr:NAD(P)-dependent glycerol-3-phosphate dehydrogenase [Candidatus Hydrogenedentota bacterium]